MPHPRLLPLLSLVALLAACGEPPAPTAVSTGAPAAATPAAAATNSRFALAADPGTAVSVEQAIKTGAKDEVLVVGRLRDRTPGFAAFTLVDAAVEYCDPKEGCPTPWDYCCHEEEAAIKTIPVRVEEKGDVVALAKIPELRRLDLVVVKGRIVKDEKGDPALLATGWFRRDRPSIGDHVTFPE
jgi:hypothetical protein